MITLVAHAVESVRQRYQAKGWTDRFRVYEEYEMGTGSRPTDADLAQRLGVQEAEVRSYLFMVRTEIRSEILSELARTCAGPDDLKAEWDAFFKGCPPPPTSLPPVVFPPTFPIKWGTTRRASLSRQGFGGEPNGRLRERTRSWV